MLLAGVVRSVIRRGGERMRGPWLTDMSFGRTSVLSCLDSKVHKASGSVSVSGRTEGWS